MANKNGTGDVGPLSTCFLKEKMARPKGFEPLTPRFVVWCSIQLSYGRLRTADPAVGAGA
jgi:hypothetical protein